MPRTDEQNEELLRRYLKLSGGTDADDGASDVWADFDELIARDPRTSWTLILQLLQRVADDDVSLIGAGLLANLLLQHPELGDRFEAEIRSNDRFLRAFQYATMTGVPLAVQQKLNAAMRGRGVDPKFLVEYDESFDDERSPER